MKTMHRSERLSSSQVLPCGGLGGRGHDGASGIGQHDGKLVRRLGGREGVAIRGKIVINPLSPIGQIGMQTVRDVIGSN